MAGEHGYLGSAQVRWNDYLGTAAADDADALIHTPSLYELAGIDREQWTIVAIDLSMGSPEQVIVYATDRTQDVADSGTVAVTAFHLHPSVRLDEFTREAFKRVSIRLLSSAVRGNDLVVTCASMPETGRSSPET
jgi:hypothetical protein